MMELEVFAKKLAKKWKQIPKDEGGKLYLCGDDISIEISKDSIVPGVR